jgi:hypothetical protein
MALMVYIASLYAGWLGFGGGKNAIVNIYMQKLQRQMYIFCEALSCCFVSGIECTL